MKEMPFHLKLYDDGQMKRQLIGTLALTNKIDRECHGNITCISFQCSECEDYNMCSPCVTSRKHLQHVVVRPINFKVK